jgi:hypothetical protein
MYLSLFTAKHRPPRTYSESSLNFPLQESPRWIASKGYVEEGIAGLAYLRREPRDSPEVRRDFAEIEAAIREGRDARKGLGLKEAFFGKGSFIRFVIAFVIFLLQKWNEQNSVGYYAPQIFSSVNRFIIHLFLRDGNFKLGTPGRPILSWLPESTVS